MITGLFVKLADCGFCGRFARIDQTGGEFQHQPARRRAELAHEENLVIRHDPGDDEYGGSLAVTVHGFPVAEAPPVVLEGQIFQHQKLSGADHTAGQYFLLHGTIHKITEFLLRCTCKMEISS